MIELNGSEKNLIYGGSKLICNCYTCDPRGDISSQEIDYGDLQIGPASCKQRCCVDLDSTLASVGSMTQRVRVKRWEITHADVAIIYGDC